MLEATLTAAAAASADAARYEARRMAMEQLDQPTTGEQIAARALAIWAEGITEPSRQGIGGNPERIWGFEANPDAMGWGWLEAYARNGQRAWCGAFAAAVYGARLDFAIRQKILPSCSRLYARWGSRRVALADIQPGDIVVVGDRRPDSKGRPTPQGNHITIALEVRDGLVYTVEGNAKGRLPDGSIGEGVIKRTRPLPASAGGPGISGDECPVSGRPQSMEVMFAYRPHPTDFV